MSFSLRLLFKGSCLFMPSPRGEGLYALLCPRGIGANPRLRFDSRDIAEAGGGHPYHGPSSTAPSIGPSGGFWPLAGADLWLRGVGAPAPSSGGVAGLEADLETDLLAAGLDLGSLVPRIGGAAGLQAAGLGSRLLLPWGTLGAWSSTRWQRLRAGWRFHGDAAGGCAFLLAEITTGALEIEDLDQGRKLLLAPMGGRMLELEIGPAESVSTFASEAGNLAHAG